MTIETRATIARAGQRCASHPARPAHDRCHRCGRPRCVADAAEYGESCCAVCAPELTAAAPASAFELRVRAGLACVPAVMIGGWIATQYVYDHIFSLVAPGLVGVAAAWFAGAASAPAGRPVRGVTVIAAVAGVLGTALGFHLLPGGRQSVLHPLNVVGVPYLCAVAGAAAWPLLFRPPRREDQAQSEPPAASTSD